MTARVQNCRGPTPMTLRSLLLLIAWVAASIAMTAFAPEARAQGTFHGEGRSLFPVQDEINIRMKSQSLHFLRTRDEDEPKWNVTVTYGFRNPSDDPREVTVGFIEPDCENVDTDCSSPELENLEVWVDGESVELSAGQVTDQEIASSHGKTGQTLYRFEVVFPPDETTEIRQTFSHQPSSQGPAGQVGLDEEITFGLTASAAWKGTVGSTRIHVEQSYRPWGIEWKPAAWEEEPNNGLKVAEYNEKLEDGDATTHLILENRDWLPDRDFSVRFINVTTSKSFDFGGLFSRHPVTECPPSVVSLKYGDASWESYGIHYFGDDYVAHGLRHLPETREAYVAELAESLSDQRLRRCRNAVYAKHGYDFRDDELDSFFYGHELEQRDGPWAYGKIGFQKNPHYSKEMLTGLEYEYAALLRDAQERKETTESGSN